MSMKKIEIDRRLYSVIPLEEYVSHSDLYDYRNTAIEHEDGTILPLRKYPMVEDKPGIYIDPDKDISKQMVLDRVSPEPKDSTYSADRVIDFSNATSLADVIQKNEAIRDIQSDLLISGTDGNTLYLNVTDADTPEMVAIKSAINAKAINKNAYEQRFTQFQNDMRLLRGHKITLKKLITMCNGFDLVCDLTLRDADNAVNPMGSPITVRLNDSANDTVDVDETIESNENYYLDEDDYDDENGF